MNATSFLAVLGGLLALAFVANRLFRLTRVPDVIVLLAVGLLLGPVSGWLQPAPFRPIGGRPGTEQDTREILFSALALCRRLPCA
jgi:Kef-type K+ transport system membrane component KefB